MGRGWSEWFGAALAFSALLGQSEVTRATDGFRACWRAERSRAAFGKGSGRPLAMQELGLCSWHGSTSELPTLLRGAF